MASFPKLWTWLRNASGVNSIAIKDLTMLVLISDLCGEFFDLFAPRFRKLLGYQALINVEQAQFLSYKTQPVVFAMRCFSR